MKMLLFSDVHVSRKHCKALCELSQDVDLVIGAGDFGALRQGIHQTIGWLSDITKPTVVVPGNAESYQELQVACEQWQAATVLHGTSTKIAGVTFFGIGGGIPVTPFGSWSYDFTEEQADVLLADCPKGSVLISHSPPYGILDVSSRDQHLGSTAVRNQINTKPPMLVVCGHIHESSGQRAKLGSTDVVNAGPDGFIFQLDLLNKEP